MISQITKCLGISAAVLALFCSRPVAAQETRLRFSGFGDFQAGFTKGDYANNGSRLLFNRFGTDKDPVNTARGFGITGTDFVVIADMTEKLTFLGEVNFQAGRGSSNALDLDVERLLVDYKLTNHFAVQGGLFFTPIGYNNRFLYARAWLMNSIQVPDFYEEELNLVPTHSVGVVGNGTVMLRNAHRLNYSVSVGNGRSSTPETTVYARDPQRSKMVTGLVEWVIPGFKDSRVGISGWNGQVTHLSVPQMGDVVNAADGDRVRMNESGVDAFFVLERRWWSLNTEYVKSFQKDKATGAKYSMSGGMGELAGHFMRRRVHPYVRYDQTSLPDGGGPYLGLRDIGDDSVQRHYVPNFKAVMTGSAYDLNGHMRLKGEFIRHLDGPRRKYGVVFQIAFGF